MICTQKKIFIFVSQYFLYYFVRVCKYNFSYLFYFSLSPKHNEKLKKMEPAEEIEEISTQDDIIVSNSNDNYDSDGGELDLDAKHAIEEEEQGKWVFLSIFDEFGNEEIFLIDGDALFYKTATEILQTQNDNRIDETFSFIPSITLIYQMENYLSQLLRVGAKFILFFSDSHLQILSEICKKQKNNLYLLLLIVRQHFYDLNFNEFKEESTKTFFQFKSYFLKDNWVELYKAGDIQNYSVSVEKIMDENLLFLVNDYKCTWSQLINLFNPSFIFTDMNIPTSHFNCEEINILLKTFTYFCLYNSFEVFLLENFVIDGSKIHALGYDEDIKGNTKTMIQNILDSLLPKISAFVPVSNPSSSLSISISQYNQLNINPLDIRTVLLLESLYDSQLPSGNHHYELFLRIILIGIEILRTIPINERIFTEIPKSLSQVAIFGEFLTYFSEFQNILSSKLSCQLNYFSSLFGDDLKIEKRTICDLLDSKLYFIILLLVLEKGLKEFMGDLSEQSKQNISSYFNLIREGHSNQINFELDINFIDKEEIKAINDSYQEMTQKSNLLQEETNREIQLDPIDNSQVASIFTNLPDYEKEKFLFADSDYQPIFDNDRYFVTDLEEVGATPLFDVEAKKPRKLTKYELKRIQFQSRNQRQYIDSLLAGTTLSKILIFENKSSSGSNNNNSAPSSPDLRSSGESSDSDNLSESGNIINNDTSSNNQKGRRGKNEDYLEKLKAQKHMGKKGKVSNKKDLIIDRNRKQKEKQLTSDMTVRIDKLTTINDLLPIAQRAKENKLFKIAIEADMKIIELYNAAYLKTPSLQTLADLFLHCRSTIVQFGITNDFPKPVFTETLNFLCFTDLHKSLDETFSILDSYKLKRTIPKPMLKYKEIFTSSLLYQLNNIAAHLRRDEGVEDKRVQFKPDLWQKKLLDIVDRNESVIIEAPTSSGKTFISYYAMKKVLERDSKSILVYVAPTKALAYQVMAEVEARFEKKYSHANQHMIGFFIQHAKKNVDSCQILITTPDSLELLFLSPFSIKIVQEIQYVIFDEIHCINMAEGKNWESAILLNQAPIVALSATLGDSHHFIDWLTQKEILKNRKLNFIKHTDRYNDLSLHLYSNGVITDFSPLFSANVPLLNQKFKTIRLIPEFSLQLYKTASQFAKEQVNHLDPLVYYPNLKQLQIDSKEGSNEKEVKKEGNEKEEEEDKRGNKKGKNVRNTKANNKNDKRNNAKGGKQNQKNAQKNNEKEKENNEILVQKNEIFWNLSMKDEKKYSNELLSTINEIANKDQVTGQHILTQFNQSITQQMIDLQTNLNSTNEMSYLATNIHSLCKKLKDENDLPVLIFHYSKVGCEKLMKTLLYILLDAENKRKIEEKYEERLQFLHESKSNLEDRIQKYEKASPGKTPLTNTPEFEMYESYTSVIAQIELLNRISNEYSMPASSLPSDDDIFEDNPRGLGVEPYLIEGLKRGIGIHHGSISNNYRMKVEQLFRMKKLGVVIATATLAFGINMPCKTVVFAGTARYFSSMIYQQMSGRAGRRGFDYRGKIIFFGVPPSKIVRLIRSKLPDIQGNSLISSNYIIKLLIRLYYTKSERREESNVMISFIESIKRLLSSPLFQPVPSASSAQLQFYFQLSLSLLRQFQLIQDDFRPTIFSDFAAILDTKNQSQFAFISLYRSKVLENFLSSISNEKEKKRNLMLVLCNLFANFPENFESAKQLIDYKKNHHSSSILILPELPEEIDQFLTNISTTSLAFTSKYLRYYVKNNEKYLENSTLLPLSSLSSNNNNNNNINNNNNATIKSFEAIKSHSAVISPYFALINQTDQFQSLKQLILTQRFDLNFNGEFLPVFHRNFTHYNAAIFDYWNHGQMATIKHDNRISLRDLALSFKSFYLSLQKIVPFISPSQENLHTTLNEIIGEVKTLYEELFY